MGLTADKLLSQKWMQPVKIKMIYTSLSGHDQLGVDKQSQWGRVTPLKTMSCMLEKELLEIPITKETTSLFLPCSGVSLNLIPLTLERVNDCAPDVSKGLAG